MSTPDIPLLDISRWRTGSAAQRRALAQRMDAALRQSGFLLIEGHGVADGLMSDIRASASRFFALPDAAKQPYSTPVGGRGWIRQGAEANAFYGEAADPVRADLKESLTMGRTFASGDPAVDAEWFRPNLWPAECPELEVLCERFAGQVRQLYYELLGLCAVALELPETWFSDRAQRAPHTFNINRYPPMTETGRPLDGQFRVAPHTDWGILTVLDRQPGYGGLQIQMTDGTWADAPYAPGAFTVNVADLMARWSGDQWRSTRHRVLPPPAEAPSEELISLIMFLEADPDTVVEPLRPGTAYQPVRAGEYLAERTLAATVP
jgi:isopenicillin N synthase-like dioxygenase